MMTSCPRDCRAFDNVFFFRPRLPSIGYLADVGFLSGPLFSFLAGSALFFRRLGEEA